MIKPLATLGALAALLLAGAAAATTVVHLDTRALATRSSDIVVGRVVSTRSYWDDSKSRILTEVRVQVDRRLKGEAANEIVLTQLGGELDGFRYEVPGSPTFARGEETLLFTWRDGKGRAQVHGLAQGKFEIRRDATGRALVNRSTPGLGITDPKTLEVRTDGGTAPAEVTLEAMIGEIETALAEGGR